MSLEEAAVKIASYLRSKDYVEVYSHHDADGIAAAAILTVALRRADIAFRLRFLPHLKKEDVERPEMSVLCDLGASIPDFPESIVIIDHHVPYAKVPFHINPRLEGIDGEYFYFVHSYHVVPDDEAIIAGVCEYGGDVVASLNQNNLFSTQFHPEKSGVAGLKILKNFTNLEI